MYQPPTHRAQVQLMGESPSAQVDQFEVIKGGSVWVIADKPIEVAAKRKRSWS